MTEGAPQMRVGFSRAPTVGLWFKKSKPPGLANGKIDIMHQQVPVGSYRMSAAAAYKDIQDVTGSAAYDPQAFEAISGTLMGKGNEGSVTYFFMDGSTITFWGYIDEFDPQDAGEKEQPMASVKIVATNYDPVNRVYAGPVFSWVSGT
jgi:hypothetical protein